MSSPTPDVVMYSTGWCPYCVRARALLERKGLPFREIKVDENPAHREAMLSRSGGRAPGGLGSRRRSSCATVWAHPSIPPPEPPP